MSESTWYDSIEVYTDNGMGKCWTCGQRLAYWEEPEELAEWMAEHAYRHARIHQEHVVAANRSCRWLLGYRD